MSRGHVYKRSSVAWTIKYEFGSDPITGKRRQKSRAVKGTRKDAEQALSRILHEIDSGIHAESSQMAGMVYLTQGVLLDTGWRVLGGQRRAA